MATYQVKSTNGPYSTIEVEFQGHSFEQTVVLTDPLALQAYADEYESAWLALPPE